LIFAGDITNQDECKTGNEYGCSDYGYTTPIDKETIIGIVGGITLGSPWVSFRL
jgi:hypothetical protein